MNFNDLGFSEFVSKPSLCNLFMQSWTVCTMQCWKRLASMIGIKKGFHLHNLIVFVMIKFVDCILFLLRRRSTPFWSNDGSQSPVRSKSTPQKFVGISKSREICFESGQFGSQCRLTTGNACSIILYYSLSNVKFWHMKIHRQIHLFCKCQ